MTTRHEDAPWQVVNKLDVKERRVQLELMNWMEGDMNEICTEIGHSSGFTVLYGFLLEIFDGQYYYCVNW